MRHRVRLFGTVALLALVVVYAGVSWLFSSKLIAGQFPSEEQVEFADFGLPTPEDVTLANGQIHLAGWYFANPRAAGCAIVQLHGYIGNKAGVLVAAPLFWQRGCDLFLYDLRSHGASSVGPITYGVFDKEDELIAVDWLANRARLPHGRIGLIGWSYGAATSLQAARARPDVAFVIADASFSSLADIASLQVKNLYGSWASLFVPGALFVSGLRAGFDPSQASPRDAVRGLTTPVLLVHSVTDEFTPYQHSEAIFANSDQRHTVLKLSRWGAPHGMSYGTDPVTYARWVDGFLDTFVPNFGSRQATAQPSH